MGIYEELGVKTYINALDTVSIYGGSRMTDEVLDAMEAASDYHVVIDELQSAVGKNLADMTHNEAAYVSSGASAGLMLCAAACMAGGDIKKLKQLPDTDGMKNEIIIMTGQITGYNKAVDTSGAKAVYVDTGKADVNALKNAITGKTAAIYYFDIWGFRDKALDFDATIKVAKEYDIPLIVDAAAQLPPISNMWVFNDKGATATVFSGGKGMLGPQGAGVILGKQWLIDDVARIAAPHHGVGRSSKAGKEEIIGLYTAVCEYLKDDVVNKRIATIRRRAEHICSRLNSSGLFECKTIYPGPTGQDYYRAGCSIIGDYTAIELVEYLKSQKPGILIGRWMPKGVQGIFINPLLLRDDEVDYVIDNVILAAEALG